MSTLLQPQAECSENTGWSPPIGAGTPAKAEPPGRRVRSSQLQSSALRHRYSSPQNERRAGGAAKALAGSWREGPGKRFKSMCNRQKAGLGRTNLGEIKG